MKHVKLTHNPYLNQTDVIINDKQQSKGSPLYELVNDRRLQIWLPRFFASLHEISNADSYNVSFRGTEQDFHDLVEASKQAQTDLKIAIKMEHVSKDQTDPDKKTSQLRELFSKAKQGPIEDFKREDIDRAFEYALEPEFEIYVLATMSAGKSTLINAFIGQDLQPSQNMACTATISRIEDHDGMKHFEGRAYYEEDQKGEWIKVDKEILREWNQREEEGENKGKIRRIELRGDIPMINSDNIRMVLVDTPGTNSAMDPEHMICTMDAIKKYRKRLVLYLMNATQLGTDDDKTLLEIVSEAMKRGGKLSHDRFIFVLNKIDTIDPEKETVSSVLDKAREYLESCGIHNPNIYPVSARLTRLIRENLNGLELTDKEEFDMEYGIKRFNN